MGGGSDDEIELFMQRESEEVDLRVEVLLATKVHCTCSSLSVKARSSSSAALTTQMQIGRAHV